MAKLAIKSKVVRAPKVAPTLPSALIAELERRRSGMARHMARAVVSLVRWDDSTGVPPQRSAIARACEAGLDLFLATAREARPAAPEELTSSPSRRLVSGQRWTAYSSWTSRVYSAIRQIHAFA